jgi:hypothetical protein
MPLGSFLKTILIGLLALAALLFVAVEFSFIQSSHIPDNYEAYKHATKEHFQSAQTFMIDIIKWFRHLDAEELIALFTGILAVATIFLWIVTQNILKESRKTTQQELRAYVCYEGAFGKVIRDAKTGEHVISQGLRFKNTGATPAVHASAWTRVEFVKTGDRPKLSLVVPEKDEFAREISTHLGKDRSVVTNELYMHGGIEYRDVFEGTPLRETIVCANVKVLYPPFAKRDEGNPENPLAHLQWQDRMT